MDPPPASPAAAASASVTAKSCARHAGGVGAAIVFGDHLDVFVMVASVQLVLDTEVGEVDRLIEVRQVVFAGPGFDFSGVSIRSPVAVWPPAIRLLQPLLVLALELVLENDAADVPALFPKTL